MFRQLEVQDTNFVAEEHDADSSVKKSYRKKLVDQRNIDKKRVQAVKIEGGKCERSSLA